MQWRCAAICAAFVCLTLTRPATAQDVTLTSRDGRTEISGSLLSFDGEFYRLDTRYGILTVDGSGVRCDGPGCPNLEDFVARIAVSGSAAMGNVLVPALLESFSQREGMTATRVSRDTTHFDYIITSNTTNRREGVFSFRITTTDEGFADLLADEADIAMALREVMPSEQERAIDAGIGDLTAQNRSQVLALDAIVPIVSPQNPVREISPLEMARVYAGEITNWAALGGPDAPIALHAPDAANGLGQAIGTGILAPVGLDASRRIVRHQTSQNLARAVLSDPFAFGVTSYADLGGTQPLVLKGTCGRVLRASRLAVKTEDYPLTAPMFLYTPGRRLPKIARNFLSYMRSTEAQVVVRRAGFVDQVLEEIAINAQGDRFANAIAAAGKDVPLEELQRMIELLKPMKRLTISFRFETGSARLDAQSRSNVVQLARALEQGRFDARTLQFVGFSDGDGPAEGNRAIARERANAVLQAVSQSATTLRDGQVNLTVDAFGEAMPLACDDSAWGRRANRRVEVWVR
ncbi:MAG: phosphate ABC transporter substrate-binding/OmpA family protein [Pseudomonadota bacterium]